MTEGLREKWKRIIPKIGKKGAVMTISGSQGGGKTGLGYYLLSLSKDYDMDAYSYGVPKEKAHILPDWIDRIRCEPDNMPRESFILLDESWLDFFAKETGDSKSREMGKVINLARQRKQVLIFISHVLAKLDIDVVREVNALLMKKPSLLHKDFERKEIKNFTEEAYEEFDKYGEDEYVKYTYVISEDYRGMLENPLPDFWSDELSCIYEGDIDLYQGTSYAELLNESDYRELIKRIIAYEESGEVSDMGWEWHEVRGNASRLNKLVREGILEITYKSNQATHYEMVDDKKEELKEVLDLDIEE